jgi:hypothetical protein
VKVSEQSTVPPHAGEEALPQTLADNIAAREKVSLSAIVARSFVKFDVALRARLLGRLLASVGPLALKVVGGGVFAKYVRHARSPEIPVSYEDAASATSTQVRDLVHYVEQSNLNVVEELSTALALNDRACLCRWHMTCYRSRIRSFLLLEAGPSPGRPPPSARGFVFGRDDLRLSLTFLLLAPNT